MEYLNKREYELTDLDLLRGFKKSGIHYGFSHFSPLWFKFVIERYNIKHCYDMFGGWGHRLMASQSLDHYIYNDISTRTHNGVNEMIEFFKIKNCTIYNNDAISFQPKEFFDWVVMSPPYDNIEKYDIVVSDFANLVKCSCNLVKNKNICLFIREDFYHLYADCLGECTEMFVINNKHSHFGKKKKKEILYIWLNDTN